MRLTGKTAIVTGASSGMGHAITSLFVKEGATVIAVARRKERLEELANLLKDESGKIILFTGDISLRETNDEMISLAIKETGKIDILVNNAGVMDDFVPIGEVTDELWERIQKVNLFGPMCATRTAVNQMLKQEHGGSIINIASIGGIQGCRAGVAYSASKAAMIGMTKNTAYMYGDKNIRCNVICPGGVDTEVGVGCANPSKYGLDKCMKGINANIRSGKASEIATATLFLASDESSLINGATLVADAGWTAY